MKKLSLGDKELLPKILVDDEAAKELGCEPGQVIEFKSKNPASGAEETSYRLVIEGGRK